MRAAYDLHLIDPPVDHWEEYEKPKRIEDRIEKICTDIIEKKTNTHFCDIYDAIYELAEEDIEEEKILEEEAMKYQRMLREDYCVF